MWDSAANASHGDGLWEAAAAGRVGKAAVELHSKPATWSSTTKSFELDLLEVMLSRRNQNVEVYLSLAERSFMFDVGLVSLPFFLRKIELNIQQVSRLFLPFSSSCASRDNRTTRF